MYYRNKFFCNYKDCLKHDPSRCNKVLTDYDLKELRDNPMEVRYYSMKPNCYWKDPRE